MAAAIVVFDLTGSAAAVGLVSVMQFGAEFFVAPWAGSLSDRFDRRNLLISGQAIQLTSTTLLTVWVLASHGELATPLPLYATTFGLGLGSALSGPAGRALVPALVPRQDLDAAVALNSVPFTIARAVGPAIGAALVLTWGAAAAFGLNAVTYAVFMVILVRIRPVSLASTVDRDRSIRAGLGYVVRDRYVRRLLVGVAGVAFAVDPVLTLTPAFAADLGADAGLVGMLASAFGFGAVAGVFLLPGLRRRLGVHSVSVGGLVAIGLPMLALAGARTEPLALACLGTAGAGFYATNATLATQVQRYVPDHLRGRVMALWGVAFLGSRPIAAMVNGAIADLVGTRSAIATAAAIAAVSAAIVWRGRPASPESRVPGATAGPVGGPLGQKSSDQK